MKEVPLLLKFQFLLLCFSKKTFSGGVAHPRKAYPLVTVAGSPRGSDISRARGAGEERGGVSPLRFTPRTTRCVRCRVLLARGQAFLPGERSIGCPAARVRSVFFAVNSIDLSLNHGQRVSSPARYGNICKKSHDPTTLDTTEACGPRSLLHLTWSHRLTPHTHTRARVRR